MPNRIIRDALLDSERYHDLQHDSTRLLYLELLLLADDFGLVPVGGHYLRRKTTAGNKSDEHLTKMISELCDGDLLRTYLVGRQRYAFVPRFGNSPRATKSKWPLPPVEPAFGELHGMISPDPTKKRIWYYAYKITHKPTGQFYLGARSSTKPPKDDNYWGSGRASKWLATHRLDCDREILGDFKSLDEARVFEALRIAENKENLLCLNYETVKKQIDGRFLRSESVANAPETECETETDTETDTEGSTSEQLSLSSVQSLSLKGEQGKHIASRSRCPPCPHTEIESAYHAELPTLRRIAKLDGLRKRALQTRWREVWETEKFDQRGGVEFFRNYFRHVARSAFLMGRAKPSNGRDKPFKSDFDFLMRASSFLGIIEGKYHDTAASKERA